MSPSQLQAEVIIIAILRAPLGVIRPLEASAGELAAKPSPGHRLVIPARAAESGPGDPEAVRVILQLTGKAL
jgi:hypothetical protein